MKNLLSLRRIFFALVLAVIPAAVISPAALAATTTGGTAAINGPCSVTATSTDGNGKPLGSLGPGGGDPDHPFVVDLKGSVHYSGNSTVVFTNHHWHVDVFGGPVLQGGDPNKDKKTSASGDVNVGSTLPPFAQNVTGLIYVSGAITGDGGATCSGSGWLKLNGNPLSSPTFYVSLVLLIFALLGLIILL